MRQIEGFPYKISTTGQVYRDGKSKPLKHDNSHPRGYKRVSLSLNGKVTRKLVHRIVGEAFIPNPNNLPHINHIDNDPTNNEVSNLEWCTNSENMAHSHRQGRCSNLIASKAATTARLSEANTKFERLLGTNFVKISNTSGRIYVHFQCAICKRDMKVRSDTLIIRQCPSRCRYCVAR